MKIEEKIRNNKTLNFLLNVWVVWNIIWGILGLCITYMYITTP